MKWLGREGNCEDLAWFDGLKMEVKSHRSIFQTAVCNSLPHCEINLSSYDQMIWTVIE